MYEEVRCEKCFGYEKDCVSCNGKGTILAEIVVEDVELTLRKSDALDDWYLIERAEHDGRAWMEQTGKNSFSLRLSSRLGNADIEGTSGEMLAIADAIEKRESWSAYRCAVRINTEAKVAGFLSPRNSSGPGYVTLARADALAKQIRERLGRPTLTA